MSIRDVTGCHMTVQKPFSISIYLWSWQGTVKPNGYIICLFIEQYEYNSTIGHACVVFSCNSTYYAYKILYSFMCNWVNFVFLSVLINIRFGLGFFFFVYWYIRIRGLFNAKAILVEEQSILRVGVMVIVVGNEHGDTSSNPGRDWLHLT